MFWHKYILSNLIWLYGITLLAQQQTTVVIFSENDTDPLIGATIKPLKGSSGTGWVTDSEGKVVLNIDAPLYVEVSYLGYLKSKNLISPNVVNSISLKEDVFGLEEVVVTGSFAPTTSSRSLYRVKKLNAQTIKARGAVNLGDVLQTQLNLKTIQDDVLGTRIVMQGISGPNVKILIDGIPLVSGTGGEFDLSQINMNNVARVEIVEGPLAVQYGTNALAGTINVITKVYEEDDLFVNTSTYYESVGQYNVDLSLAKGWKNTSVNVGGARNQFVGFSSTGERNENWVPRVQYLANAKIKTTYNSINFTGSIDKLWQNSINRGNASLAFNNKTGRISEIANDLSVNTDRLNGTIAIDGNRGSRHYFNLVNGVSTYSQGSRRYIQDIIDDVSWLSTNAEDHDTTSFTTYTFRGTYVNGDSSKARSTNVTLGYEVSLNYASGGRIRANTDGNINEYGLFTAVEIPLGLKLKIQPAMRYTYSNSYDTRNIDFLNANLPLLPSLNILFSNESTLDLRLSYGQGFRTPSVRELYYEFVDANHYIVGDVDLQPEVGHNLTAASTFRESWGQVTAAITPSVFFSRIDNKIDLIQILDRSTLPEDVPKTVPVARVYGNIPNFKSYGANLAVEMDIAKAMQISPGVGLLARSGSEADDHFYNSYEANLTIGYLYKKIDAKFNVFYKYNGNISEFSRNHDGSIGVLILDDYHTLDMSASKSFFDGVLFTTIGVKNAFNVTDISLSGEGSKGLVLQTGRESFYPISWGRTFFMKFNYLFN